MRKTAASAEPARINNGSCQGRFCEPAPPAVRLGSTPVFGKPGTGAGAAEVGAGAAAEVGAATRAGAGVEVGVVGVEVGVVVGVEVTGVEVGVGVGAGVTTAAAQVCLAMVLVSNVTAPLRARIEPLTEAPVVTVTDVKARIFPAKLELVPSVADEPTCQKTLQAWAPLVRVILLPDAVVRADPTWKTKTAFGLFCPSNVNVPVRPRDDAELYTPGVKVRPPKSPETVTAPVCALAAL